MDTPPLRTMGLCAGVGGLELGLAAGLRRVGLASRLVCLVEREAFAAAALVHAMEEGRLDPCPIWTDLRAFDGAAWRGAVDCITAGYPCQPFSSAGKRLGAADPRHLWPDVLRVVREAGPVLVFLENVGRHARDGLLEVRDDLRGAGYRVEAGLFRAEDVGAPHRRERVFILALADGYAGRLGERADRAKRERESRRRGPPTARDGGAVADESRYRWREGWSVPGRPEGRPHAPERGGSVADHEHPGLLERGAAHGGPRGGDAPGHDADGRDPAVADGRRERLEGHRDRGAAAGAARRGGADMADATGDLGRTGVGGAEEGTRPGGLGRGRPPGDGDGLADPRGRPFPPGPADIAAWVRVLERDPSLAPAQSSVRRVADGAARRVARYPRVDGLRAAGNAVVPSQAAHAFAWLWGEAMRRP